MTDPKLPDGVHVEGFHVADHHLTERRLCLSVLNPELAIGPSKIAVTIDGTIDTRNGDLLQMPKLWLENTLYTRKQWEAVKRLGDLAWAEFERRISDKETL
jgi:hypothetical protein